MDDRDNTSSDRGGLFKSWMPWKSDPAHVSRDFWMPDQSCRVCYECDSEFKLFNRRHHCRLCGRIFCSKCTSNWILTESEASSERRDRIRVCNYCFKQWEKDQVGSVDNGVQVTSLNISNSALSENSYISTKSSETCCSNATFFSMPQSAGLSPLQSPTMKTEIERQSFGATNDHVGDEGEQNISQDEFEFYGQNRGGDDDEEFALPRMDSQRSHFSQVIDYYGNAQFDDISSNYTLKDDIDSKIMSRSSAQISFDSPNSKGFKQSVMKGEHDIGDEFEGSSSMYVPEDVNTEPVDFEDNGILWLPPEPEDKEDEREELLFEDDDDDGQGTGEWGYLHNSSSFGSGESRVRDESNDGQKKVMKTVVEAHFRALVAQLLQAENLISEDETEKEGWLEIVIALSWEAATLLKPDTSKGGQMDPGGYVKVKCLASGLRSESSVVKGIVFKKNVAHRRMALKIEKPRFLILGGALEYHRVCNAFSSVNTLLKQETDYLKMAIAKIEAHKPRILLVEKSVSRYAQDYLLAKDISLVLNIKRPILERIARCTGAQIVPSIDHLSSPKLGYCEMFHVERCSEEHVTLGQAGKRMAKTLMYFEGCPKPLGCTILLRGANVDELKKVKHVVQYGVFAAYHLALETSFLADEGASLSEFPLNPPITAALLDKALSIHMSISTIPRSVSEQRRSNIVLTSDLINVTTASVEGVECSETCNLPMSPNYANPSFMPSIEDFQHSSLNEPSTQHASEDRDLVDMPWSSREKTFETDIPGALGNSDTDITQSNNFEMDASRCILDPSSLQTDGKQISDEQLALKEEFPPSLSANQSILVSLSSRCVWKGTVCERSQLLRIKYYGSFDKPLGRFLRDHLFDQNYICRSCEMPAEAHVQCYNHRQGTLTISVKKLPEIILPGEKDGKIWMWHRCLRCPRANGFPPATRRIVMSDAAWGLSFGKFLELSFSNHAAASRVANCGHSLHRDCLRFYGFGKRVACFRYASIDVHSVYLPPSKLDFNYESQEWIERELDEVVGRAEHLFSEVLNALHLLVERKFAKGVAMSGMQFSESKRQISDLEEVLQKEKSELEETFQKILNKEAKKGQPIIDILELNRLRRQLIFQSYIWDHRLIYTASSDMENQPNDIKVTQKPPGETEKISDTCDTVNLESNVADAKEPEQNPDRSTMDYHPEIIHVQTDTSPTPVALVSETKSLDESSVTVRGAFSNGEDPNSLSQTLESAWTGESHSESFEADSKSAVGFFNKSEVENHRENLSLSQSSSVLSSRGSDHLEETVSWLTMPFVSFYRSLNKNFLGPAQKLDTLGEYDPVYISSFRDSELQGGARLLLPVGANDIVIPVYDDEPTSIISYALLSPDYFIQLSDEPERVKETSDSIFSMQNIDVGNESFNSLDEVNLDSSRSFKSGDESMHSSSMSSRSSSPLDPHARVSFSDDGGHGNVKYTVTCYYAKHFESLRKICCPSEADFVRSLSRCKKWGAQGGKSNVFFAKTLDDRFIVKQVTKTELESFLKFAPGYFNYLSESIVTRSPTSLAKTLGIYQVTSKHLKGGKETKMDVLVMENVLFGRNVTRLYDLKGSSRSRYNPDSSGSNKVLLDQNLLEAMPTSPIFVGNKAKKMLERAVWNDTAFLASIDVMDYSLLVGVDEEKQELVVGIIDFMRQYTWDKHLETWVKASGILGGPKNASPTVISPLQYKRRFRKAMTTYFLMVPDQWSPSLVAPGKSESEFSEENEMK